MSVFNSPFNQVFHNPFGSPFNGDASSGTTWTPAEWFLANEQGLWLDPSDFTRYMGELGPELVTNGTFDTNTTGWTAALNCTISAVAGRLRVTATGTPSLAQYSCAVVPGRTYKIRANYVLGTAATAMFRAGTTTLGTEYFALSGATVTENIERTFTATGNTLFICAGTSSASAGQYADFDNISVQELTAINTATMFQDSVGAFPVTAVEQPVGLMLDKRLGAARGVEQIIDPEFNDPTKWTTTPSWTISGGKATHNGSAADYIYTATEAPAAGEWYEATVVVSTFAAGSALSIYFGQTPAIHSITAVGTHRIIGRSPGTGLKFSLRASNATGLQTVVESFSVRPLPGNHALQSTAASRPVLSARKNKLLATTTLATQAVTLTASPNTLSFKGTGTVTLSGASTAGPLVGTGAGNRVSLTFTPSAGSVTFTVSGSVTEAQLENGSAATTYQRVTTATDYDTVGFPLYLKFDGVDDFLSTGNIDFTATDKMTVMAGVTITSTGVRIIYEHGANPEAGSGFGAKTGVAAGDLTVTAYSTAATSRRTDAGTLPIGQSTVLSHTIDIAGATAADEQQTRLNGITPTYAYSSGTGTGNLTSQIFYIGRRGGTSMSMGGNIYQLIVRGAATPLADIQDAESFTANKAGVTL